jgi:hypothetical protein
MMRGSLKINRAHNSHSNPWIQNRIQDRHLENYSYEHIISFQSMLLILLDWNTIAVSHG